MSKDLMAVRGDGIDEASAAAWGRFRGQVADLLAEPKSAAGGLLVGVGEFSHEQGLTPRHVQIEVDCWGVHVMASPNDMLEPSHRLSRSALGMLRGMGFRPPSRRSSDLPDGAYYSLLLEGHLVDQAADITVRVLRDVFGAIDPHLLTAFPELSPAPQDDAQIRSIGQARDTSGWDDPDGELEPAAAYEVNSPQDAVALVERSLAMAFGHPVERDHDGDWMIVRNGETVYVTVSPTEPRVTAWVCIDLAGRNRQAIARALSGVNRSRHFIRAWSDPRHNRACLAADVLAHPFVPGHFLSVLATFLDEVRGLEPILQEMGRR